MVFAYFAKAQLPFSLFRDLFNDTAEFTLCYGLHDCSHLFQGYFIHSLSTLYYYNAPSLTTRLTGDYRDRTYTGKCSPALLDTRKKGSGIAGFLIFLVISSVIGKLLDLIPVLESMELTFVLYIAASFAIAAVLYVISGWIMEKKLSV